MSARIAARLRRAAAAVLVGVLLALASAAIPAQRAEAATARAADLLASLRTAPRLPVAGYSSAAFAHWTAPDGTCRTTALRVLGARTSTPLPSRCSTVGGTWTSAFTGRTVTGQDVRVRWTVPLRHAWRAGAAAWTPERRQAFANDLAYAPSLLVVDAAGSLRRGSKPPTGWMPVTAQRCAYAKAWIGVKARWGLAVTATERAVLARDLRRYCGRSPSVAAPGVPDVAALTRVRKASTAPAASLPTTACPSAEPSGGDLRAAVSGAAGTLRLGRGAAELADFAPALLGVDVPASVRTIRGAADGSTVLRMTRCTSTHAADVPTATGTTNQLSLVRVSGSPAISDLTVQGTEQGHRYNGLRLSRATGATLTRVTVRAIPGNSDVNPGETFGINDYRTRGTRYRDVLVDGAGIGATGLGINSSADVGVADSTFTRNRWSAGIAIWQTRDVALDRVTFRANRAGLNLERVAGAVTVARPVFDGNRIDLRLASDRSPAATVVISDPVITRADGRLRVALPAVYRGVPNTQARADLVVLRDGVDVTADTIQWVPWRAAAG